MGKNKPIYRQNTVRNKSYRWERKKLRRPKFRSFMPELSFFDTKFSKSEQRQFERKIIGGQYRIRADVSALRGQSFAIKLIDRKAARYSYVGFITVHNRDLVGYLSDGGILRPAIFLSDISPSISRAKLLIFWCGAFHIRSL